MSETLALQQAPTPEELKSFREEIAQLYEDEQSHKIATGHFTDPFGQTKVFDKDTLGPQEFLLWVSFKDCQIGVKPVSHCLQVFRDYQQTLKNEEIDLAKQGLVSYVGNKLTFLSGREQLEQARQEKKSGEIA